MHYLKKFFLILFLLILLIYVTNITTLPDSVILFQRENLDLQTVFGVFINEEGSTVQTSTVSGTNLEKQTIKLSLFNIIDIKDIEISIIPETTVIPLGNTIGLKLYSTGVLVIGLAEIEGEKPYENSGIIEGDLIVCVNEQEVTTTSELIECVNNCNGQTLEIKYLRNGKEYETTIAPAETEEDEYKIGLWVRDGAAGIGTITYYEPATSGFAALGHGILDTDTETLITIASGELVTTNISSIKKGEKDTPGEIRGTIKNGTTIGEVTLNTPFGIYGTIINSTKLNINNQNEMKVALREEIELGPAKVILTLEDEIRKEYDIEITKIYKNNNEDNKSMMIEVIDEELINLTGGIVQRNEWSTGCTKWKVHWCYYTCAGFKSTKRLCNIWRFNDKTVKRNKLGCSRN